MYSTAINFAEPVIQCPFNPSHTIAQSRIQKHIVKCEKNYPPNYKFMCPYNATHRISPAEMNDHILSCTESMILDPDFVEEPKKHGTLDFAICSGISSTLHWTENWELEMDSEYKRDSESLFEPGSIIDELGYSIAAMKALGIKPYTEDTQSIVSGMAAGRGTSRVKEGVLAKLKRRGRGK